MIARDVFLVLRVALHDAHRVHVLRAREDDVADHLVCFLPVAMRASEELLPPVTLLRRRDDEVPRKALQVPSLAVRLDRKDRAPAVKVLD